MVSRSTKAIAEYGPESFPVRVYAPNKSGGSFNVTWYNLENKRQTAQRASKRDALALAEEIGEMLRKNTVKVGQVEVLTEAEKRLLSVIRSVGAKQAAEVIGQLAAKSANA